MKRASATYHDSKPHFLALDGLRGVAALIVLAYHLFESFATSQIDQVVNHGYLAVDFFFILSGFVIAYAYDKRIQTGCISSKDFFKRRLIRLQPMIILGAVIGAICFYFAEYEPWAVREVRLNRLLWATLLTALLIPVSPRYEVRGNGEMYPLNGPYWSLLFEYIGNLIYLLLLRKLSNGSLKVLVILLGISLSAFAIYGPFGGIGAGWTMDRANIIGGLLRILFSFSFGLLISRNFRAINIKGGFWMASFVLIVLLGMPRIGGEDHFVYNALYEIIVVTVVFPMLIIIGASDSTQNVSDNRIKRFLGDLSYPLYTVHYPFLYLYYSYVKVKGLSFAQSLPEAALFYFGSVAVGFIALKVYNEPVRKWLTKKYIKSNNH